MPDKDVFRKFGDDVADTDSLEVGPSDVSAPAVEIQEIIFGGACDVKLSVTVGGTEVVNETIHSFDSSDAPGISMGNEIKLVNGMTLRVTNTSDGSADYVTTGVLL